MKWFERIVKADIEDVTNQDALEEKMILDKHKRISPDNKTNSLWRNVSPNTKLKPRPKNKFKQRAKNVD